MGTRSTTKVIQNEKTLIQHYRHYDGYPSGHGIELALALIKCDKRYADNHDDLEWTNLYLSEMNDMGCEAESTQCMHCDLDYEYEVTRASDGTSRITIWDAVYDDAFRDRGTDEPEFEGTPRELIATYDKSRLPPDDTQARTTKTAHPKYQDGTPMLLGDTVTYDGRRHEICGLRLNKDQTFSIALRRPEDEMRCIVLRDQAERLRKAT